MQKRKKREFHSSELLKSFAKIYGFENKLLALEVKDYLLEIEETLDSDEIKAINITDRVLVIRIQSPMLKHNFRLRTPIYLQQIQEKFGKEKIIEIEVI